MNGDVGAIEGGSNASASLNENLILVLDLVSAVVWHSDPCRGLVLELIHANSVADVVKDWSGQLDLWLVVVRWVASVHDTDLDDR